MNLFDDIPDPLDEEDFLTLATNGRTRIERIVSKGHVTPEGEWYDQPQSEWVLVVRGAAELVLEAPDERVRLAEGDFYMIWAHRRHRVAWTDPDRGTVWVAVHLPSEAS